MAHKIYFGNVEIMNIKTRQRKIIERVVFLENESLTDAGLRSQVLKEFKTPEREYYQLVKLCVDTARFMSYTAY